MRLKELFNISNSKVSIVLQDKSEHFNSVRDVPILLRNYEIASIDNSESGLIITLGNIKKILIDFEYSL